VYVAALEAVAPGVTADPRPGPTAAEALAETGSLAYAELEVLCGGAPPPEGAVSYDVGGGSFWLTSELATARGMA
jgi:hypothetical protein